MNALRELDLAYIDGKINGEPISKNIQEWCRRLSDVVEDESREEYDKGYEEHRRNSVPDYDIGFEEGHAVGYSEARNFKR